VVSRLERQKAFWRTAALSARTERTPPPGMARFASITMLCGTCAISSIRLGRPGDRRPALRRTYAPAPGFTVPYGQAAIPPSR